MTGSAISAIHARTRTMTDTEIPVLQRIPALLTTAQLIPTRIKRIVTVMGLEMYVMMTIKHATQIQTEFQMLMITVLLSRMLTRKIAIQIRSAMSATTALTSPTRIRQTGMGIPKEMPVIRTTTMMASLICVAFLAFRIQSLKHKWAATQILRRVFILIRIVMVFVMELIRMIIHQWVAV